MKGISIYDILSKSRRQLAGFWHGLQGRKKELNSEWHFKCFERIIFFLRMARIVKISPTNVPSITLILSNLWRVSQLYNFFTESSLNLIQISIKGCSAIHWKLTSLIQKHNFCSLIQIWISLIIRQLQYDYSRKPSQYFLKISNSWNLLWPALAYHS